MRTIVSILLACSLLAPLGAQRLAVYGPIVGNFVEVQPPTLPLGTSLFMQALTFCAADPVFGLVFTPMSSIYVSSV